MVTVQERIDVGRRIAMRLYGLTTRDVLGWVEFNSKDGQFYRSASVAGTTFTLFCSGGGDPCVLMETPPYSREEVVRPEVVLRRGEATGPVKEEMLGYLLGHIRQNATADFSLEGLLESLPEVPNG